MSTSKKLNGSQALLDRLMLLGEVLSTETALFHQKAAAKLGLGVTDLKAWSVVVREGPITAGQLAVRLGLTTGAITSVINRLVRAGYINREAYASDRRKIVLTAREERKRDSDAVYESMGQAFMRQLNAYSVQELTFLSRYYDDSIAITRNESAKLSSEE